MEVHGVDEAKRNEKFLSKGEKSFVFFIGLASAPGCLTVLFLVAGLAVEAISGHSSHSSFHDQLTDFLKTVPAVLALLGILTHPVALLATSIGSFSRMSRRAKLLGWTIVASGILGWAVAYGVIWIPYQHQ